tara:strand:- start:13373 stop:15847 length:2475 start_codon:yes stop_codon:yes gene_type:complete
MKLNSILIAFAILIAHHAFAQKTGKVTELANTSNIVVDGVLNELEWGGAEPLKDFIELEPNPGQNANQNTEIKILYNNRGLYFGVSNFDTSPDSILTELSQRDNFGNVDWAGLIIDPYQAGLTAFGFFVTAAGVQADAQYGQYSEDFSWNAVWRSSVKINDHGWTAEVFVPFSALRFPEKDVMNWNFNALRLVRRTRQKSSWNRIDPKVDGFLNQFGTLEGLKNIETPVRLQLFPYFSMYYDEYDGESNAFVNGGMDVKFGLSDAFTLDMTLIPDFGQVQSDNQVLNLSPFEVRFNENRQFFTEGTELFNKGGLFYSRRIGSRPINSGKVYDNLGDDDEIIDNPNTTQLLNATKVSGRLKNGLGIGVFNAITRETTARIRRLDGSEEVIETAPASNYNVLVFDQNLKNNSSVSLVNTNVMRAGSTYDANVTGLFTTLRNKKATISTDLSAIYNKKSGLNDDANDDGFAYAASVRKISGNINYGTYLNVESDTYDPNDLGFLFNANEISNGGYISFNQFKPKGIWNRASLNVNINYGRLYKPQAFTNFDVNMNGFAIGRKFNAYGMNAGISPVQDVDYFEPRQDGYYYNKPKNAYFGGWYSSDYRKSLAFDANVNYTTYDQDSRYDFNFAIEPRIRFNNHLLLVYSYNYSEQLNNEGYALFNSVGSSDNSDNPGYNEDNIYFGRRDITTHTNILQLEYKINPLMYSTLRMRHYWSKVLYNEFVVLQEDGSVQASTYSGSNNGVSFHDNDFNAFNIDLVYTYVLSPGSRLDIVYKKSLFNSNDVPAEDFADNARSLKNVPGLNSLSLKFLYFIDYNDTKLYLQDKF